MDRRRLLASVFALMALTPAAALARSDADFPNIPYATWTDDEPPYRVYAGDELDITVPSAPELSKTVTVAPDGRITLPLIGSVMAADRSIPDLQATLHDAYAGQLLHPDVEVAIKTASPLKVFVGGEVDKPGLYDMVGDMDALRAIIQAGGFRTTAKMSEVVIIRRGPDGRAMMRTANMKRTLKDPGRSDFVPLRRFDIVYVPKTGLAEVAQFVQQLRDVSPVQFSYALNGNAIIQ